MTMFKTSFCVILFSVFLACLSGCQSIDVRGQYVSDEAINEIKTKHLSQDEIVTLIGTPNYVPEYSHDTWYYIQRSLSRRAWFAPKVSEQRIVKIDFDKNAKAKEVSLLEKIQNEDISTNENYTKTLGTEQSSVQKFVKNIGRFNKTTDGKKKGKQKK